METRKEIYQKKVKAKLDQINAQIGSYRAQFDEAKADTKLQLKDQIDELSNQQETVQMKFEEMKNAGDDAWSEMRSGLDDAVEDLETSYNNAVKRISEMAQ